MILWLAMLAPAIAFSGDAGPGLRKQDIAFASHGIELAGTVVLPREAPIHAAVVFVHGSGKQARDAALADRFAAQGIAALVYDKRGAGRSGGEYEGDQSVSGQNIALLADDAVAALQALTNLPDLQGVKAGFAGISQAGWIAPLAARRSARAQFLLLWSGPVCKVSEEDIYSKYTADTDGPIVPTYREALAARKTPYVWPDFLGRDTDAGEDLAKLDIPGLWIFSDNDGSVPVDLSIRRLQALRRAGHRYDYILVPGLGHNNLEQTFAAAVDWVRRSSY